MRSPTAVVLARQSARGPGAQIADSVGPGWGGVHYHRGHGHAVPGHGEASAAGAVPAIITLPAIGTMGIALWGVEARARSPSRVTARTHDRRAWVAL